MDPVKILKRAWHILWSYRALWVFGLILALATSGSAGPRAEYQLDRNQQMTPPEDMQRGFEEFTREMERLFREGPRDVGIPPAELTALIWLVIVFMLVMLVLGIVMAIARYVSETAVIRMVDEYENTNTKMSVREGFRIGWSRTSWRLFLIDLIVSLPAILLVLIMISMGIGLFFGIRNGDLTFAPFGIVASIGMVFLLTFVVVILSIFLNLLRHFFWRVCALEGLGVQESLNRGWGMVRENWKNVGLMWLVMIGLGIVWVIVSILLVIITIPLVVATAVIAAIVFVLPYLLFVGIFSIFLGSWLPWIAAGLFVAPLFFTLAFSPWVLLGSWQSVFTSSVWTLTYREIKALPAAVVPTEVPAAS